MSEALQILVTRGGTTESVHRVDAAVMRPDGTMEAAFGDAHRLAFPRSGIKALQALPLVESGAADAFGLSEAELALACSSHNHEPVHVHTVTRWLGRIGCSADDLGCGVQPPEDPPTVLALERRAEHASAVYNNCSGKHTGFLSVARHLGEPLAGYTGRDHPVQVRIRRVLEAMTGHDTEHAPWGWDGCSIPTLALPLSAWALGMARLADPRGLPPARAQAATRLTGAISAQPVMIGGEHSWDSNLIRESAGAVLAKRGAEGIACGWLPQAGLGFCLKVADGDGRAVPVAMGALCDALGWLSNDVRERMAGFLRPVLHNWNGYEVGALRPA